MRLIAALAAVAVLSGAWIAFRPARGTSRAPAPAPLSPRRKADVDAMRERARRLVADRGARPENLSEAISLLEECREILKPMAGRSPEAYVAASESLQEAERLREALLADLWVDYQRRAHLRDNKGAQAALRQVLRVVPDRADPRNERARRELSRWMSD